MAFSILLTNKDITNFENAIINSFLKSPLFNELNEAVKVNKWKCKTEIYRRGSIADKNYSSHIIITLLTSKGKVVKEKDEPLGTLMSCNSICFFWLGKIYGIDLLKDKEFISDIKQLTGKAINYYS